MSISEGKNKEQITVRFTGDIKIIKAGGETLEQIHFISMNSFDFLHYYVDYFNWYFLSELSEIRLLNKQRYGQVVFGGSEETIKTIHSISFFRNRFSFYMTPLMVVQVLQKDLSHYKNLQQHNLLVDYQFP
jgi:hypothetical protein